MSIPTPDLKAVQLVGLRRSLVRPSSINDFVFKRGPATAGASLVVCNMVGNEQVCQQGDATRHIVIRGPGVP